jgi:hypothetical protein
LGNSADATSSNRVSVGHLVGANTADQTKIRNRIREILTSGVPNARKAMCEAMIKEIVIIADDTVRPIFKLPVAGNDEGLALDGPALSDSEHVIRALPTMVGDTGIEPVTSSVSATVHQARDQHKHEGPQVRSRRYKQLKSVERSSARFNPTSAPYLLPHPL